MKTSSFKILMLPWLAHGHIFPYLELAKRILKRKSFHFYLCSTAVNLPSIAAFIDANSLQNSIETVELHLKPSPNLPPHLHTTKNLPSHLRLCLLKAFQTAESSFSHIITLLSPDLIVFDIFQPWAASAAAAVYVPAVHFGPFGAATMSYLHHICTGSAADDDFPFRELLLTSAERASSDSLNEFLIAEVFAGDEECLFVNYRRSSAAVLLKTSRSLEGKYVDYLSSKTLKRILPVGSLVKEADASDVGDQDSDVMQWLGERERSSTVYVSFGSEHFMSEAEIAEMAEGLELSAASFLWVVRFPAGEEREGEKTLPEGFLERTRGKGWVVFGWAPQARILGHPSTGAFVSHCGWSSLNESVYYGVPVVAMPMKINMFVDARMAVEAGVGVAVGREEGGVYKGEEIARAIDVVVVEERGESMRCRAREISERMRREEEGAIDDVAELMWKLCFRE